MASSRYHVALIACCVLVSIPARSEELRTWTDSSGTYSVEATLVTADATSITVRTRDGRQIVVPMGKLSSQDKEYLKNRVATPSKRSKSTSQKGGSLHQKLATKTDFQLSDMPLDQFINLMQQEHDLPITMDGTSLAEQSISKTVPITYAKSDVPLGDALSEILSSISLEWTVYHQCVVVTTPQDAENHPVIYVYQTKPASDLGPLIQRVVSTVEPNTWEANGGPAMLIALPPRSVIISQSIEAHKEILRKFSSSLSLVPNRLAAPGLFQGAIPSKLFSTTIELNVTEVPLVEFASRVSKAANLEVVCDNSALQEIGYSSLTPITAKLPEMPVLSALLVALQSKELTLNVRDKAIVITTHQAAERELISASYKVASVNSESLRQAIKRSVIPDSWRELGGPSVLEVAPGGNLQVKQTVDGHLQLIQLLSDL